jgi:hypothetical protein
MKKSYIKHIDRVELFLIVEKRRGVLFTVLVDLM